MQGLSHDLSCVCIYTMYALSEQEVQNESKQHNIVMRHKNYNVIEIQKRLWYTINDKK